VTFWTFASQHTELLYKLALLFCSVATPTVVRRAVRAELRRELPAAVSAEVTRQLPRLRPLTG
jgi:hypothetical protein